MKNKKLFVGLTLIFILVFVGIGAVNVRSQSTNVVISQEAVLSNNLIQINFPIYIDGNWSDTVALYDWCTGSGTEEDPWVIEGIHVTNEDKTAHIWIDKAENFVIRNVVVSEYSAPYGHYTFAGIYIEKGEYGLIENCTIINSTMGLSMFEAKDEIKIIDNVFIGSHNNSETGRGAAILIQEAKGVEITNNDIYNYYDGIVVYDAEGINIEGNRIETSFGYISDTGIYFYGVNDSSIIDNDFYGCEFAGHEYDDPFDSSVSGLKISFDSCYNIEVYGNRFYDLNGNLIGNLNIDNLLIFYIFIIAVISIVAILAYFVVKKIKMG